MTYRIEITSSDPKTKPVHVRPDAQDTVTFIMDDGRAFRVEVKGSDLKLVPLRALRAPRVRPAATLTLREVRDMVDEIMAMSLVASAYSADAFGTGWRGVAVRLVHRGYNVNEAAAIMGSKWTRWCRDAVEETVTWGRYRAKHLDAFLDKMPNLEAEVAKLVAETFGGVA